MKDIFSFLNDDFIPADRASILVTDLAIQRGYGVFDYCKTLGGNPIFLEDHLNRFYNSARHLRLPVPVNTHELRNILGELMKRNAMEDSGFKLTLTGGYSADGYSISEPNFIITQHPLVLPADDASIQLVTYDHQRQMPEIKTIDYLMAIWLRPFIEQNGADEVLYFHENCITECPRANFFLVDQQHRILTPSRNILHGVIRRHIMSLKSKGFEVIERDLHPDELLNAKEAFITSTTKNILPVSHINNMRIGTGTLGEVSHSVLTELKKMFHTESVPA